MNGDNVFQKTRMLKNITEINIKINNEMRREGK